MVYARVPAAGGVRPLSATSYLECGIVLNGQRDPIVSRRLDHLLEEAEFVIEPVTERQARLARHELLRSTTPGAWENCRAMGDLQVAESVVAGVAKSLRAVADDTKSDLAGLDGELSRLLGAGWTGQAGSAFDKVWAQWHEGANNVVKGLEAMASALEEAAHSYGATDAAGEAAINSAGM